MYRGTDFYTRCADRERKVAGSGNMTVGALRALGKQLFGVER